MDCKIYVNTEIQVMHFPEQSVMSSQCQHSARHPHAKMMLPVVTAPWCGDQEGTEAVKLLMPAPNLGTGKLATPGSPTSNQSSAWPWMCVRSLDGLCESHTVQRAHRGLCSLSPGLHFLHSTCQRHSTKSVPSAPASKHWAALPQPRQPLVVPQPRVPTPCSCWGPYIRGVLLLPSFSLESSQAQGRIPAHLHSDNTAFQKGNPKQWIGCRHIHLSSPKSTQVPCECLVTPVITC